MYNTNLAWIDGRSGICRNSSSTFWCNWTLNMLGCCCEVLKHDAERDNNGKVWRKTKACTLSVLAVSTLRDSHVPETVGLCECRCWAITLKAAAVSSVHGQGEGTCSKKLKLSTNTTTQCKQLQPAEQRQSLGIMLNRSALTALMDRLCLGWGRRFASRTSIYERWTGLYKKDGVNSQHLFYRTYALDDAHIE